MLAHGYNHICRGGKIKGTAGWFASLGMKPGILHAWLASLTELAAGAVLVAGLLTPLAAGALIGMMLVAFMTNHLPRRLLRVPPSHRRVGVLDEPRGRAVRDRVPRSGQVVARQQDRLLAARMVGLAIALVIGVGGAAALLVTFWRPVNEASRRVRPRAQLGGEQRHASCQSPTMPTSAASKIGASRRS